MREELIALFDRELVESQEALGATIIGQFRDARAPDRFVWLRGFSDMESRGRALREFYGGPVWKRHRETANATMLDSDDVLLLRPSRPGSGVRLEGVVRAPIGAPSHTGNLVFATIYSYEPAVVKAEIVEHFERSVIPSSERSGNRIIAYFQTESAPNNFPALPVREGENVFVCFSTAPMREVDPPVAPSAIATLELEPTARSLVRG